MINYLIASINRFNSFLLFAFCFLLFALCFTLFAFCSTASTKTPSFSAAPYLLHKYHHKKPGFRHGLLL
jgi:hypothetical protein